MSGHDPCCPLDDLPVSDCTICTAIALARGEEMHRADDVWKINLPLITRRVYAEGYADGAAGHRPRYP